MTRRFQAQRGVLVAQRQALYARLQRPLDAGFTSDECISDFLKARAQLHGLRGLCFGYLWLASLFTFRRIRRYGAGLTFKECILEVLHGGTPSRLHWVFTWVWPTVCAEHACSFARTSWCCVYISAPLTPFHGYACHNAISAASL